MILLPFFFLEQRSILGTVVYFVVSCSEMGALRDATCKYNLTLRVYCPFLVPPLLLKQQIRVRADNMGVETAGVKHSMNPFDEIAVEEVGHTMNSLDLDSTFCIRNFNAVLCFNSRRHFNSDVNGPFFHVCAA